MTDQANLLTLDYAYRNGPFVQGAAVDLTTLDYAYRNGPYTSNDPPAAAVLATSQMGEGVGLGISLWGWSA